MYNSDNYKLQNRIIREVATEMGLDPKVVYKVVRSQWDFLKDIIKEQEEDKKFFSLKIRYLGLFGVKNHMFRLMRNYKHLYVPKDKIYKHIDPRKQNTN
jgi:hypothetical protein